MDKETNVKHPPIIQVIGYSNSGKTTLICKMIKHLKDNGYRVGSIKHDAHDFEIDKPGKDTWKHKEAGADVVAITSTSKTAVMIQQHRSIDELLPYYENVDVVIVEGYKFADYPKIVVIRNREHEELLENVSNVLGVASWYPIDDLSYNQFDINESDKITGDVLAYIKGDK